MTDIREDRVRYGRFLKLAAAVLIGLLALGYLPTVRSAGADGVSAMVAGGAVSLAASVAGTLPLLLSHGRTPADVMPAVMGSIALRLTLVILLTATVVWSGTFATRPLLIWVAISHVCLLVADTLYARGVVRSMAPSPKENTP